MASFTDIIVIYSRQNFKERKDEVVPVQALKSYGGGGGKALPILNPLNAELNPICHLLELLGDRHIFHISRIRVNFASR
jgi:hypothetical protein